MRKQLLSIFIYLLFLPIIAAAQTTKEAISKSIFQYIITEEIEQLTISADFDSLFTDKKNTGEIEAFLLLHPKEGKVDTMQVKIGSRGVFRRKYCDMPPLRINFNKKQLKKKKLQADFDKLKLVTHCMEEHTSDQVVLKEFWAYKLYNQITPYSFKTHLFKVQYINSSNPQETDTRWSFLIENNKEMAQRLGGELIDSFGVQPVGVHSDTYHQMVMFNYMIGNLDWKLPSHRNLKLVQHPEKGIFTVPYDFDMSAIVWPAYARLNPDYGQQYFEERFCLGVFASEEELKKTIQFFMAVKGNYKESIESCPVLNNNSKKQMIAYLDSFYYILAKERRYRKAFSDKIGY